MSQIEALARRYWSAEEGRDLRVIMEYFAPDAEWEGPEGMKLTGRKEIRTFYAESIAKFPKLRVTITRVHHGAPGEAAFEWGATFGDAAGREVDLSGVNIMRIGGTGDQFVSLRAAFDPSLLAR